MAIRPNNINFVEAAAALLAGLTALQIQLSSNQKILIQVGAGGVGIYARQLAKILGAYVVTTARQNNHEFVKSLGADFVIDYKKDNKHRRYSISPRAK